MEHRFGSGGNLLAGHLARPPVRADVSQVPAVILAHGYPSDVHSASEAAAALPELADRIAAEMGWLAFVVGLRGCAGSEGSFSLAGWLADLQAAVAHLRTTEAVSGVWIAGFGTGGALAICAAAGQPRRSRASPPWARPPTSTTGPPTPAACSSTPGTSG